MKTMIKLAKTNKSLPILQTVIVKNGTAYSTDMDMEIYTATDMNDGIYHAEGFGSLNVLTEFPWDVLPERLKVDSPIGSIDIALADLAWIAEAMSNEAVRYCLCGVFFDGAGKSIVATDGHVLNKISMASLPDAVKHLVPDSAIKHAILLAKECKVKSINIVFWSNDRVTFNIGKAGITSKIIDGTFPDYQRVIPSVDRAKHVIKWNQADILAAEKEIKSLQKIAGDRTAAVKLNRQISAYGRHWKLSNPLPFDIGFNLAYISNAISGDMALIDAVSPCGIRSGDKTAVIMPMRL